jgi:predicted nucleic-acid-binding protein
MNIALDTSVVVRLLTGEPPSQAHCALAEIEAILQQGNSPVVSDMVVAEVYFALQHHYRVPKAAALSMISQFLAESGVRPLGASATVLATPNLATVNPGFVDRLIHAEYMQTAKEVLTFEKAAGKLSSVRVLNAS